MDFKCKSQVSRLVFGKDLLIYVYRHTYLHTYEEVFGKAQYVNLVLTLKTVDIVVYLYRIAVLVAELQH